MIRIACAAILLIGLLSACRSSSGDFNLSGTFPFGDTEAMLSEMVEVVLEGHETEFGTLGWSGGGGGHEFAYDTTVFIKNAKSKEVSSRLASQVDQMLSRYALVDEGGGKSGFGDGEYSHIHRRYRKDGAIYFTDFLIQAYEANDHQAGGVKLMILHKGVRP